jgi:hypothetical protein
MDAAKKTIARTKNFVTKHKTPITIVATAAATAVAMRNLKAGALKEAYEFIEANGLTHQFVESTAPFTVDVS